MNKNQITGTIELESFVGTSREVVFVATGGVSDATWTITVDDFGGGATGTYTLDDVPAGTTGLSAKTAWNLRSKVGLVDQGDGQATADLTGVDHLPGGDLNGTNGINIQDYTLLKTRWLSADPLADIDGGGDVGVTDYTILKLNWFKMGDDE